MSGCTCPRSLSGDRTGVRANCPIHAPVVYTTSFGELPDVDALLTQLHERHGEGIRINTSVDGSALVWVNGSGPTFGGPSLREALTKALEATP